APCARPDPPDAPAVPPRPGGAGGGAGRVNPTVAHAPRAVVERAVELDHLDSRDPHLPRRAAAGRRLGGDRDPGPIARAVQGAAAADLGSDPVAPDWHSIRELSQAEAPKGLPAVAGSARYCAAAQHAASLCL